MEVPVDLDLTSREWKQCGNSVDVYKMSLSNRVKDRNVTSIDELRSLVPNEELLNDFLSFLGGVEAQNEEDKLIVLARLQSKNGGKEKYVKVMEEDMSVLSKLEKEMD